MSFLVPIIRHFEDVSTGGCRYNERGSLANQQRQSQVQHSVSLPMFSRPEDAWPQAA